MKERRLVRSATLNGYTEAAIAAGLDPATMFKKVGLSLAVLKEPDRMISLDAFLKLLAISAAVSGLSDFGIRAAHARGIPDLGMVSLLMREADDVEAAIRLYTSHVRLHSDGTLIQLDTRFEAPIIAVDVRGNNKQESMQVTQFGVTGLVTQIRWLIGEEFRPALVCFSHPKPSDTQFARRIFQCDVRYNQMFSGIVLNKAVLRRPLVTSPPFLRRLALKHLQPLLKHGPDTFAMRVTRLIGQRLDNGDFSSEAIAQELAIDRRTLTRRLTREGTTHSSLLQSIRLQVVQQGLDNPVQSLTELSCSTGFQSLSAFSRWFKTEFGHSATELRARTLRGPSRAVPKATRRAQTLVRRKPRF